METQAEAGVVATLERYFEFAALKTTWRTEIVAGFTTFVTMAYIVFVNPSILHDAGMPLPAVFAATCIAAAVGSLLMGILARYPIALAPGMGLNAYFTYTVVKGMGIPWQTALGAVFLSGVAFLVLTMLGVRQWIVAAIPQELYSALSAGIGLFIAFIGFKNAGIIKPDAATMVTIGTLTNPQTALALFGVILIVILQAWKVRASILLGILGTTAVGAIFGLVHWSAQNASLGDMSQTMFRLDIKSAAGFGFLEIVFIFLFVDLFDNVGTLVAISKKAGLQDENNQIPRVNRILYADSIATIVGSLLGTTTVVSYVESAAGVAAGGRTGVPAIITGLLFLSALFAAPLIGAIPAAATAPALIVVGSMMLSTIAEIPWDEVRIGFPAFLILITIPLTFSIANGLAFGLIAFVLIHVGRGRYKDVPWPAYPMAGLLLLRFFYLAGRA